MTLSLIEAVKNSNLDCLLRQIGAYTIATNIESDGHWLIYLSNGDNVLLADLGDKEIDELQNKLGLNNRQGVVNLIGAALRNLQQPPTSAGAPLTLPVADAQITLSPPADLAAARRRIFGLLSGRAQDLAGQLEASRRDLELARSNDSAATSALGLAKRLGVAAGGGAGAGGKRAVRTALPGMSLLNPMQRKRPVARGVVYDDEDEEQEEDKKKDAASAEKPKKRKS